METFLAILPIAISLLGTFITANANKDSVEKTNQANKDINDANLAYNKEVQETTWQREDSAWQRGVADAKAAGLSPLAVTSGSTSGATVGAPSAIPMQATQYGSMVDGIVSAFMQQRNLSEQSRQFNAKLEQEDNHFKTQIQEQYDQMENDILELNMQISSAESEAQKDRLLSQKQLNQQLLQQLKIANQAYTLDKKKFDAEMATADFHEQQKLVKDRIIQTLGDGAEKYAFEPFDGSYDEYVAALRVWNQRYSEFRAKLEVKYPYTSGSDSASESSMTSKGNSGSSGFSAGLMGASAGSTISSGKSSASSSSTSGSSSRDYSRQIEQAEQDFYRDFPYPVWFGDVEFQGSSGTYRGYYGKKAG